MSLCTYSTGVVVASILFCAINAMFCAFLAISQSTVDCDDTKGQCNLLHEKHGDSQEKKKLMIS